MIGGISSYASKSYSALTSMYRAMSSGNRINSAADDAAGLAISEKMKLQSTAYTRQNANARDEQNQLNIQDGKLATTTSALQRMYELGLQASNGTYGAQEKRTLQAEVDQLKDFIGSDKLAELGLTDYDVTANPDLSAVKDAVNAVSSARGDIGAKYNGLSRQISARDIANENLTDSLSQIADLDYGAMINRVNTEQTLFQMRLMMQKNQMANMYAAPARLLGFM